VSTLRWLLYWAQVARSLPVALLIALRWWGTL
jgi:hypothetical protein